MMANEDIHYAIRNDRSKDQSIRKIKNRSGSWIIDGAAIMSDSKLRSNYRIFENQDAAQSFLDNIDGFLAQEKQETEKAHMEVMGAMRAKAEQAELLFNMKANVLKEFRIRTFSVPLPKLKKAMFSITGNKQFNKWSYNPTKDDDVFRFITVQQIDEVYEVLNFV